MDATIELISRQELRLEELSTTLDEYRIAAEEDGNIDADEQQMLDRLEAKMSQARSKLADLKVELENNRQEWEAQAARVDVLQTQLRKMEQWGHPEIDTLRGEFVRMTDAEFSKKWRQATKLLDQAEVSFTPAFEFFEGQSAAQPRYEQRRSFFDQRMAQLRQGDYQTEDIKRLLLQLETNIVGIDAEAQRKNFVEAIKGIEDALSDVEASERSADKIDKLEARYVSLRDQILKDVERARKIDQHEAKEALKLVDRDVQKMEAAAAKDRHQDAMKYVDGIRSVLENIFIRERILDDEKLDAEINIRNLKPLAEKVSDKRYEKHKRVIEAFTKSFESYKRLHTEKRYEDLDEAWSDLEPKAKAFWDAIRVEDLGRRVIFNLKELEPTIALASTSEFSHLDELQKEISEVEKSLRQAIKDQKWFDAEDYLDLLKPLLRAFESRRKEQQELRQQYLDYLSELRGDIAEAFPGHEDSDNKLIDLKIKISDVDDKAAAFAKATDFENAMNELAKIDALLFEVYALNSGKVRSLDISDSTNEAIKVVVNEAMNAFASELNTVAANFESFTESRADDDDDGDFGSDMVGFVANVVGVFANKHPVWAIVGFSVSFATDISSTAIDGSKDASNQSRQIVKNLRKLASETLKLFGPKFGETLMTKQPRIWDALAEHVALNDKELVAQSRIRTHLYSIGLPPPGSGFGKDLYKKMIGRFLVWEHDQKLIHRLNDHKGHVGEPEISDAIDKEIESVYADYNEEE